MKKLNFRRAALTLSLCATVLASVAATVPARADGAPQLPPFQNLVPDLKELKLRQIEPLYQLYPNLYRAELSCQIFVKPTIYPYYKAVYVVVQNSGIKDSGPFHTYIKLWRPGYLPAYGFIPMSVPAGGYKSVGFLVYAPYGISSIFAYADAYSVVPEYNELNNADTWP